MYLQEFGSEFSRTKSFCFENWDRLYLGRALRTKETLPDFHEWCRVTRHPRIFRGLTGCQRTPEKWGVTCGETPKSVVAQKYTKRLNKYHIDYGL